MNIRIGGVPVSGELADLALLIEQVIYQMSDYYNDPNK